MPRVRNTLHTKYYTKSSLERSPKRFSKICVTNDWSTADQCDTGCIASTIAVRNFLNLIQIDQTQDQRPRLQYVADIDTRLADGRYDCASGIRRYVCSNRPTPLWISRQSNNNRATLISKCGIENRQQPLKESQESVSATTLSS